MGVKAPISRKHADILRAHHFNARERAIVLRCVDLTLIKIICEISLNILNGNIPKKSEITLEKIRKYFEEICETSRKFKE